jgi:hypothetical protein
MLLVITISSVTAKLESGQKLCNYFNSRGVTRLGKEGSTPAKSLAPDTPKRNECIFSNFSVYALWSYACPSCPTPIENPTFTLLLNSTYVIANVLILCCSELLV